MYLLVDLGLNLSLGLACDIVTAAPHEVVRLNKVRLPFVTSVNEK